MNMPNINGTTHSWCDVLVTIEGVPITGISAVKYEDEQEKENQYGAGNFPIARGRGKVKCTASITLHSGELLSLQKAAPGKRLQDYSPFDVYVNYIPKNSTAITTDVLHNCEFTKLSKDIKSGDMKLEVELPLIISHISWNA